MQLTMLLAADYATVDASRKLNILGVFSTIYARQFPVRHPSMHLVVKFQPSVDECGDTRKIRVVLMNPDQQEMLQLSGDLGIPSARLGQSPPEVVAVLGFTNLEFLEPGTYTFKVFLEKEYKGELEIHLEQMESSEE